MDFIATLDAERSRQVRGVGAEDGRSAVAHLVAADEEPRHRWPWCLQEPEQATWPRWIPGS